jgi:hypothetical protein
VYCISRCGGKKKYLFEEEGWSGEVEREPRHWEYSIHSLGLSNRSDCYTDEFFSIAKVHNNKCFLLNTVSKRRRIVSISSSSVNVLLSGGTIPLPGGVSNWLGRSQLFASVCSCCYLLAEPGSLRVWYGSHNPAQHSCLPQITGLSVQSVVGLTACLILPPIHHSNNFVSPTEMSPHMHPILHGHCTPTAVPEHTSGRSIRYL